MGVPSTIQNNGQWIIYKSTRRLYRKNPKVNSGQIETMDDNTESTKNIDYSSSVEQFSE